MNQEFIEKEIQMDLKYMKKKNTKIVPRTKLKLPLSNLLDWQKPCGLVTLWGPLGGNQALLIHVTKGRVNWCDPCGGQLATFVKITNALTFNTAIPLLEIYPTDILAHTRNALFKIIHFGINNGKRLETTQCAVIIWD